MNIEDSFLNVLKNKTVNLTEEKILDRLLDRLRWPYKYPWGQPSIEAILQDGSKHQNFFSSDNYLDSEACVKCYEEGYTLIFSNIGSFCKDTWIIQQLLNNKFNANINCNFYFGNGKKSVSFNKHNHDYPVIVKNIFGKSKWIIDEKEIFLDNQDCIWFDKFVDHQVVSIEGGKLSLTCNIQ
tara:strand:+ start:731 stop:1276 length:546 start_codon:yes stop_codon:yes gene_type:complete